MKLSHIAKRFRIDKPETFRLSDYDPAECFGLAVDKRDAKKILQHQHGGSAGFVVPADHKWFSRIVVAAALVQGLESLDLNYPKVTCKALKELRKAAKALKAEKEQHC